jgi:hypothetical protein
MACGIEQCSEESAPAIINIDLSYLGRQEAQWVLAIARKVLGKAWDLLRTTKMANRTQKHLIVKYNDDSDRDAKVLINHLLMTYIQIYENLANRLTLSLNRRLGCLPTLARWLSGSQYGFPQSDMRNMCAHQADVAHPLIYHSDDRLSNRPFDTGHFFDCVRDWMPPLIDDLNTIIEIIGRDIDKYPILEHNAPDANYEEIVKQAENLREERHPGIVSLQNEEDSLRDIEERLISIRAKVESGERNLRQQRAIMTAKELYRAEREFNDKMHAVIRLKLSLAQEIYEERDAAAMQDVTNNWNTRMQSESELVNDGGDEHGNPPYIGNTWRTESEWAKSYDKRAEEEDESEVSLTGEQLYTIAQGSNAETADEAGFHEVSANEYWGDMAPEQDTDSTTNAPPTPPDDQSNIATTTHSVELTNVDLPNGLDRQTSPIPSDENMEWSSQDSPASEPHEKGI